MEMGKTQKEIPVKEQKYRDEKFFRAIITLLKEKGRDSVSFDPMNFDSTLTKNELPWCNTFDRMVDTVSLDADDPCRVFMSVEYDGFLFHESFTSDGPTGENTAVDENIREDWESLFFFVYDEVRNDSDPEDAEEWIDGQLDKHTSCPYCHSENTVILNVDRYQCNECKCIYTNDSIVREDLRHELYALLADTSEDSPRKCDIILGEDSPRTVGLSTLEMRFVIRCFAHDDGTLWFLLYGEEVYTDFDDMSTADLKIILSNLKEENDNEKIQ